MRFIAFAILSVVATLGGPAWCAESGLVAHYTFDEGSGSVLRDASGNGNDGTIRGARFVKRGRGYCLEFDGVDDFVNCGNPPSLDLRDALTLEAWVFPAARVQGEPGIVGKHFESYLLSFYSDGQCWWYISSGGNNAKHLLTTGAWHHLVGTFDGKMLKLYLDGKLVSASPSKFDKIKPGKNFFIGCVLGDPNAPDPNDTRTAYFPGMVDEVRVYHRALSEEEVRRHFEEGIQQLDLTAQYHPVTVGPTIREGDVAIKVGRRGQVQIDTGSGSYAVESFYSYPGQTIGWNVLSESERGSENFWLPQVRKVSTRRIDIEARGRFYNLRRRVQLQHGRIEFEDELMNLRDEPVGFIVRHHLTAPQRFKNTLAPGGAENPTIFVSGEKECLGLLVEDNLSRLRFEPSVGLPDNQVRFKVSDFALDKRRSYTLRWRLYPLPKNSHYFDFINRIRQEWNTNFTIEGPFAFFDVGSMRELLDNREKLKAYLQRKRLRVVALSPWLDYDPGSFDRVWTREEYKERMQRAMRVLKSVDPSIKCVGCIETDWVTIDPERLKNGDKLPRYNTGSGNLNAEQTRIIEEANLPWKDSVKRRADGNLTLELYARGGKPQTALHVYPALGNYQYEFLMGQVRFLLNEVGLDGFYIDEFSQAWRSDIRDYSRWDGWSAEVDPRTGRIRRTFTDCSLAGIGARYNLIRYALNRGKIVIANTYATAREEQALPVNRFAETQASFDPFAAPDGVKPPEVPYLYRGALASPIGLGIVGVSGKQDTARRIMRAVITYLRHGMVYYHYAIGDIPATGEGSGEYGPINHSFPITPIALHEGWIEGEERTITCVSGNFVWRQRRKPTVHLFDLDGREKPHNFAVTHARDGWTVQVRLRDWTEIAVIE
jgi:hypothetical protein